MPETYEDPVVAEIHATRAAMLQAAGGDIGRLMRQVAQRQRESKHHVITTPFRYGTESSVPPGPSSTPIRDGESNAASG